MPYTANRILTYAASIVGQMLFWTTASLMAQPVPTGLSNPQVTGQPARTITQAQMSQPFNRPVQNEQYVYGVAQRGVRPGGAPGVESQSFVRPVTHSEPSLAAGPQAGVSPLNARHATAQQPVRLATGRRSNQDARTRIVRTVSSLGVVGGLMMGFVWWTRKTQSDSTFVPASDLVEVVGRVALGSKNKAHVVRFGDRLLLLSLDGNSVSKLGEIGTNEMTTRSSPDAAGYQRRDSSV